MEQGQPDSQVELGHCCEKLPFPELISLLTVGFLFAVKHFVVDKKSLRILEYKLMDFLLKAMRERREYRVKAVIVLTRYNVSCIKTTPR